MRKNQYSAVCQVCYDQLHVKCTDLELTKVKKQLIQNQLMVKNWTCSRCLFRVLPFHSVRYIDQQHEGTNQNDSVSSDAVNEHLEALTSRPNQLSPHQYAEHGFFIRRTHSSHKRVSV